MAILLLAIIGSADNNCISRNGIGEANPIISALIQTTSSPLSILVVVKFIAIALAYYCWRIQSSSCLRSLPSVTPILVAWNMVALIVGSGALSSVLTPKT